MIAYLYLTICVISVFYLIIKKPEYILFLFIIIYNFGDFIIAKSNQDLFSFYPFFIQLLLFFSIILYGFINHKIDIIFFNRYTLLIFITVIYLAFLALMNGTDPVDYFIDYRRNLSNMLIIPFILSMKINHEFLYRMIKFLLYILIFNIIIAFIQNFGGPAVYDFFSPKVFFTRYGTSFSFTNTLMEQSKLIKGTFLRMNELGNYVALLSIIIAGTYKYLDIRIITFKKLLLLLIFSGLTIIFTGNRISLICFMVGLFLIFSLKNYKYILSSLFLLILIVVSYAFILQSLQQFVNSFYLTNTPIGRISFILNADQDSLLFNSTLYLSYTLIPFFIKNLFFGAGLLYQGGYGLVNIHNNNTTDATLILYLAEFGIIGFFIFISPIINLLIVQYRLKYAKYFRLSFILFIAIIVQMVTDAGLFYKVNNFILFAFMSVLFVISREKKFKNKKISKLLI